MNVCAGSDDLGIKDVGLDEVDQQNPAQNQQRHVQALRQRYGDRRNGTDDRPKDGNQAQNAGYQRQHQSELDVEYEQADGGEGSVHQTDHELATDDAGQPDVELAK